MTPLLFDEVSKGTVTALELEGHQIEQAGAHLGHQHEGPAPPEPGTVLEPPPEPFPAVCPPTSSRVPRDSGVVGINGAAARLIRPGDLVITIAHAGVDDAEARELKPLLVFVDEHNAVLSTGSDPADTGLDSPLVRGDLVAG